MGTMAAPFILFSDSLALERLTAQTRENRHDIREFGKIGCTRLCIAVGIEILREGCTRGRHRLRPRIAAEHQ